MSKINETRELMNCNIILEHYRFIKKMNEMSTKEFCDFIYGISPAAYSAFKNKGISNAQNIIADYLSIINSAMKAMKNEYTRKPADSKSTKRHYQLISLYYIRNTKSSSPSEISKKLNLCQNQFCRHRIDALKCFAEFFNTFAERKGYHNALSNIDVRIIEIARLDKKAKTAQSIA